MIDPKKGFHQKLIDKPSVVIQGVVTVFSVTNLIAYVLWNNYAWGNYLTSDPGDSFIIVNAILALVSLLVVALCRDIRYALATAFVQIDFLLSKYLYLNLYVAVKSEKIDGLMLVMVIVASLLVMAVLGLVPAKLAKNKGENFLPWFVYGMFGTFFAIPHALSTEKGENNP